MSAYTDMYKTPKKQNQNLDKQKDNIQNAQNDFGSDNQKQENKR